METDRVELERITLATTDLEAMSRFYDDVFGTGMVVLGDGPFRLGRLAETPLLLCPNEIAEVDARQNRHQLRLAVADLDATIARVEPAGGHVLHVVTDGHRRVAGIVDPDNNTYELIERETADRAS